tara:strand:- start:18 stop:227 length:210 start_codon:yes stop_codon:yes gene_type:complete
MTTIAELKVKVRVLEAQLLICNAERSIYQCCLTDAREHCRTMFNVMYKGELMNKEKVWANLCLSLGIEA